MAWGASSFDTVIDRFHPKCISAHYYTKVDPDLYLFFQKKKILHFEKKSRKTNSKVVSSKTFFLLSNFSIEAKTLMHKLHSSKKSKEWKCTLFLILSNGNVSQFQGSGHKSGPKGVSLAYNFPPFSFIFVLGGKLAAINAD